jgi:hypothetical protein
MDADILNAGLDLAMAWGQHWLQPIQGRLAQAFPALDTAQLDAYDRACREAMRFGHGQVPVRWAEAAGDEAAAERAFAAAMRARYPWVSADNLGRLFSQGCYYAWKNGEIGWG